MPRFFLFLLRFRLNLPVTGLQMLFLVLDRELVPLLADSRKAQLAGLNLDFPDRWTLRFFGAVHVGGWRTGFRFQQREFEPFAFSLQEVELLAQEEILLAELADQEYIAAMWACSGPPRSNPLSSAMPQ